MSHKHQIQVIKMPLKLNHFGISSSKELKKKNYKYIFHLKKRLKNIWRLIS
jgi:hypothetical protein